MCTFSVGTCMLRLVRAHNLRKLLLLLIQEAHFAWMLILKIAFSIGWERVTRTGYSLYRIIRSKLYFLWNFNFLNEDNIKTYILCAKTVLVGSVFCEQHALDFGHYLGRWNLYFKSTASPDTLSRTGECISKVNFYLRNILGIFHEICTLYHNLCLHAGHWKIIMRKLVGAATTR